MRKLRGGEGEEGEGEEGEEGEEEGGGVAHLYTANVAKATNGVEQKYSAWLTPLIRDICMINDASLFLIEHNALEMGPSQESIFIARTP